MRSHRCCKILTLVKNTIKTHFTFNWNELKICSFNCEGFNSSTPYIPDLCMLNDIIMLQETCIMMKCLSCQIYIPNFVDMASLAWILNSDLYLAAPMVKSLDKSCAVLKYDNESRILGLEARDNAGCRHLFLNVYFP